METQNTIRVGIVGAGNNTRLRHIPGLDAIDGVSVVRICNRTEASSQKAADEFGIDGIAADWRDIIGAEDIDAVVIGTWPYLHYPVTVAALSSGKHVLCEARMASTAREAHDMLDASRARPHLVTQIVPSPLTFGVDGLLRHLVADGYLELNDGVIRFTSGSR